MKPINVLILALSLVWLQEGLYAQANDFTAIRAGVFFDEPLRDWDGFGFNYVQSAHFIDYELSETDRKSRKWWAENHPGKKDFVQEYGGFSLLDEKEKQEIVELVFGDDGLKPGIVKMFLDAKHQTEPGGQFNHETTTNQMRHFVKEGLKLTRNRGNDFQIITTLYGPPAYITKQKLERGRDLDPEMKDELAMYMIDWVKFLKEKEGLPVKYLSLHNEGEDWSRWEQDGSTSWYGHDYNLYWPPEQINEFLKLMPDKLKKYGLYDVGITNGELSNWYRFSHWGYADFIARDREAHDKLSLITTHGFYGSNYGVWFGEHNSYTNDVLRKIRPELHSWVTSTSWAKMDAEFVKEIHGNIYTSKVNAIIPWAGIQRPAHWVGGDPNPGSAIRVYEDGTYEVLKGYYFYKQVSRAGQPGMKVVRSFAMQSEVAVIGFEQNGTKNPDAFVVINYGPKEKDISVEVHGSNYETFEAYCTSNTENFVTKGAFITKNGAVNFTAAPGSVTTFFGQ